MLRKFFCLPILYIAFCVAVLGAKRVGAQENIFSLPPIQKVEAKNGLVYVNDRAFVGDGWNTSNPDHIANAPGSLVRWPHGGFLNAAIAMKEGKPVDLVKTEPLIENLEKSGRYAVLIIEPYWGAPVPEWSQVSWQGKLRGGQGLDTNACWRNPNFIADRLQKVRDTISMVKRTPRAHDRILGFIVWNENRWAMGEETCYCPHCRKAWPIWLKNTYGSIRKLNDEYATRYQSFEQVPMPTPLTPDMFPQVGMESMRLAEFAPRRRVSHEKAWRDFHLFKADGLIEFEKLGAAAAKAADPSRLVITSIFTRGVNPLIGHVLLRLYRALDADPNIDIIGGNMYEVFPVARAARHVAMWKSVQSGVLSARRKPVWFTEFNDIGSPWEKPYDTKILNATLAHTTFSGASGRIWFTDQDASRLSVLEADGTMGERYRLIAAASELAARNTNLIEQAARNDLPPQVAIIDLDEWNALADNDHYNAASLAAHQAFEQWAGFATRYIAEPEIRKNQLKDYRAAVLWQAQRSADISEPMLRKIREFVQSGGTLYCDPPLLQDENGAGPMGEWQKFFGVSFRNPQSRAQVVINDAQLGRYKFSSGESKRDLGLWDVSPTPGTTIIKDEQGRPAIAIHAVGKGRVVTFCFRLAFIELNAIQQTRRAELLQRLLAGSGLQPLVNCPQLEKTVAPQDNGGLLVTVFNPRDEAVTCPLTFPNRSAAKTPLTVVRSPQGAQVQSKQLTIPAGEWAVFTIR